LRHLFLGEEAWDGFLLERRQLIPTAKETWAGIKVVIDAVMRKATQSTPIQIQQSVSIPQPTSKLFNFIRV
jgi:hypothetical protein